MGLDSDYKQPSSYITHKELWEILVPTISNTGKPLHTRFHKVWDQKVRKITGGLTVHPVAKGQWENDNSLYAERVIPVRIAAFRDEIDQIIKMTLTYYNQLAIMAYKISDEVVIYRG